MLIRFQYCSYNFQLTLTSIIFLLPQLFDQAIVGFLIVDCSTLLHIEHGHCLVFLLLKLCDMLVLLGDLLFLLLCSLHCIIIEFFGKLQLFTLFFPVFKKSPIAIDRILRLLVIFITVLLLFLLIKFNSRIHLFPCFGFTELILKLLNTEVLLIEL